MVRVNIGNNVQIKSYPREKLYSGVSITNFITTGDDQGNAVQMPELDLTYNMVELNDKIVAPINKRYKSLTMSNVEQIKGYMAMAYVFSRNENFESLVAPSLVRLDGDHVWDHAFYITKKLTNIDISKLNVIRGKYACCNTFYSLGTTTTFQTLNLDNLEYIGLPTDNPEDNDHVCSEMFQYTKIVKVNMSKLKCINGHYACEKMFGMSSKDSTMTNFSNTPFSKLETLKGNYALKEMFQHRYNLSAAGNGMYFPVLTTMEGDYIFYYAFYTDTNMSLSFNAPLLTKIKGNHVFDSLGLNTYVSYFTLPSLTSLEGNVFEHTGYIKCQAFSLPALEEIIDGNLYKAHYNNTSLRYFRLPEVKRIIADNLVHPLENCLQNTSNLQEINLSKLKKIQGTGVFYGFCRNSSANTNLASVTFTALDEIIEKGTASETFYDAFQYRNNMNIYFPALKSYSFDPTYLPTQFTSTAHPFYRIFGANGTGGTVHLPSNLENEIINGCAANTWTIYGTNNKIVFDLAPTE